MWGYIVQEDHTSTWYTGVHTPISIHTPNSLTLFHNYTHAHTCACVHTHTYFLTLVHITHTLTTIRFTQRLSLIHLCTSCMDTTYGMPVGQCIARLNPHAYIKNINTSPWTGTPSVFSSSTPLIGTHLTWTSRFVGTLTSALSFGSWNNVVCMCVFLLLLFHVSWLEFLKFYRCSHVCEISPLFFSFLFLVIVFWFDYFLLIKLPLSFTSVS